MNFWMMTMSKAMGLILCHGHLAEGLVSSISCIFGDVSHLKAFSNSGKAIPDSLLELKEFIDTNQLDRVVIFVDLVGGSCWRVAKQLAHENKNIHVFAGVNVPMLVQFVTKFESIENGAEDWVDLLLEKSRKSIQGA